jgi:hypothetical protein
MSTVTLPDLTGVDVLNMVSRPLAFDLPAIRAEHLYDFARLIGLRLGAIAILIFHSGSALHNFAQ